MRSPVLAAAVCLAAASWAWPRLGPVYGGEVLVGVAELPRTSAPGRARTPGGRLVAGLVHETLVRFDDDKVQPGLAEAWSAAASGLEWTLALSPAARDHEGRPLGAADAVRSVRRFLRSDSPAAARLAATIDGGAGFRDRDTDALTGLDAPDARHLVLRFAHPVARPLAPLAAPAAAITGADGVGAGPFVPTLPRPTAQGLVLAAFSGHVRGRPFADAVRVVEVEAGAMGGLDAWPDATADGPWARALLLILPPAGALAEVAARRAFADAIDRGSLASRFVPGGRAARALLPPTLRLDPRAAEAEPVPTAHGPRTTFGLDLVVDRSIPAEASRRILASLAAAGFEVRVRELGPDAAWSLTDTPRVLSWLPEVSEPGLALRELAPLAADPDLVLRELGEADGIVDEAERADRLADTERRLLAGGTVVPLALETVAFATSPRLQGARVLPSGRLVLEDAWIAP